MYRGPSDDLDGQIPRSGAFSFGFSSRPCAAEYPAGKDSGLPAEFVVRDAHHLRFRSGLAGPDFELARSLLDKHLKTANYWNTFGSRQREQRCFERVVDHVEHDACIEFVGGDRQRLLVALHAARRGVDQYVKTILGEQLVLQRLRLCLASECDSLLVGSIDDKNFCALLDQSESCGPRRAAGSQYRHARALQSDTTLQRSDNAGNIRIEPVELAVGADAQ